MQPSVCPLYELGPIKKSFLFFLLAIPQVTSGNIHRVMGTHLAGLLSSLEGVEVRCFLLRGRPRPRLVRLRLSSSCCCCCRRSLTGGETRFTGWFVTVVWHRSLLPSALADILTACPAAFATCSGAAASPCRSSAARPTGCDTPPPWRPAGPQTSCSRAEGTRGEGRFFHTGSLF